MVQYFVKVSSIDWGCHWVHVIIVSGLTRLQSIRWCDHKTHALHDVCSAHDLPLSNLRARFTNIIPGNLLMIIILLMYCSNSLKYENSAEKCSS